MSPFPTCRLRKLSVVAIAFSLALCCAYVPKPTVWTVFGELAKQTGASNLGQGFPDWTPPSFLLESLMASTSHQYTRPAGHPELVELLAERYSRHLNREVHPMKEVAITVGASQALYLLLIQLLKKDDEVVIFEPFFDLYLKQVALTGATPKFVPLGGSSATLNDPWAVDLEALERSITPNTKVILLNSPHNPTGKVFTLAEMEAIADIVRRNPQITVISDEVYKFTVYNPLEKGDPGVLGHYHFARLPDMWDRTVTISSAGKTFSVTGWQVGWMVGPERIVQPVQELLPCVQFCAASPIQEALARSITIADLPYENYENYYEWLRSQFSHKRAILEKGLLAAGIEPLNSHGGFFLMAKLPTAHPKVGLLLNSAGCVIRSSTSSVGDNNISELVSQQQVGQEDEPYDWAYCRMLATEYGVAAIPTSSFFAKDSAVHTPPMARFAICKLDTTLREAAARLSGSPRRSAADSDQQLVDALNTP